MNRGSVVEGPLVYLDFKVRLGKFLVYYLAEIGVIIPPHHLHDFADHLSRNNSTPYHPWPRPAGEFQPYVMKYDGRSPYHILHSNHAINRNNNQPNPVRERHLLLRIDSMVLEPGEKGHFTVSPGQVWDWVALPNPGTTKQYLEVSLVKGNEQSSFICRTPLNIDPAEPMAVENTLHGIHGVHPNQLEFFNPNDAGTNATHGFLSRTQRPNFIFFRSLHPKPWSKIASRISTSFTISDF